MNKSVLKLLLGVAVWTVCSSVNGQELRLAEVGLIKNSATGEMYYYLPRTVVSVDLELRHEIFVKGPYARFAQKYIGVIAPLADRESWSIESASICAADLTTESCLGQLPEPTTTVSNYLASANEFARLSPDRMEMNEKSTEEMAAETAKAIFALRQNRQQLLRGSAGDFGAGLSAALDELDRTENEYLALFLGKQSVETSYRRCSVVPTQERTNYVVCRFTDGKGVMSDNDLTGVPVVLTLQSDGTIESVFPKQEGGKKASGEKRLVADMMKATVVYNKQELGSQTVAVWQFGTTVYVAGNDVRR